MKTSLLLCGLLFGFLFVGCDSSTGPGTLPQTSVPRVGASYTFTRVTIDTFGRIDPLSEITIVDSVEETGLTYGGRSNVVQMKTFYNGVEVGRLHFNYEANGDFSEYVDYGGFLGLPTMWVTYPIQSRRQNIYTLIDTTVVTNGTPNHLTMTATISFAGVTTMQIHDTTVQLVKLRLDGKTTITPDPEHLSYTVTADMYFAPSIGYVARMYEAPYRAEGRWQEGTQEELVDYFVP